MLLNESSIVAAVQFAPKLLDVDNNLAKAQQLVFEAAAKGAKLIVLPELALSGYALDSFSEAAQCAQTKNGYQTEAFVPLCTKFNCHVVFGYVELNEGFLYNSAAVVGPKGLEASAQKHNLHGRDALWARPSEQMPPVVITAAGRTGVLVCRDVMNNYRESYMFHNPKHRFYRKGDVDTIALLTNWSPSYAYPDDKWLELVESTGTNLVVSNRTGFEREVSFMGGSAIIDKTKKIYTFGSSFTEAAVVGGVVLL